MEYLEEYCLITPRGIIVAISGEIFRGVRGWIPGRIIWEILTEVYVEILGWILQGILRVLRVSGVLGRISEAILWEIPGKNLKEIRAGALAGILEEICGRVFGVILLK